MITINLVPQARKRRHAQLSREDKTLIFAAAFILFLLGASWGYTRYLAYRAQTHLNETNTAIASLNGEQKLLDLNRALAQRSLAMETNISNAVRLQVNTNKILDDIARDLPKACVLTQTQIDVVPGTVQLTATSLQFLDLVRFFNALSADTAFKDVRIDGYQVPYNTTGTVQGGVIPKATMNLSLTWAEGGQNG